MAKKKRKKTDITLDSLDFETIQQALDREYSFLLREGGNPSPMQLMMAVSKAGGDKVEAQAILEEMMAEERDVYWKMRRQVIATKNKLYDMQSDRDKKSVKAALDFMSKQSSELANMEANLDE